MNFIRPAGLAIAALITLTTIAPAQNAPQKRNPARPAPSLADSPVRFPQNGTLPTIYPPDIPETTWPAEPDYFHFSSPCRSAAQIREIQAAMPKGTFTRPPAAWQHLPRTRRILTEGGGLCVLGLGDSIVNDTMRSGWLGSLGLAYPKARIKGVVVVRGGGGCQHYKEGGRVARYVLPHKPDLVFIGGISQRDMSSCDQVIREIRAALPETEFLLATGAFGAVDPRDAGAVASASGSGTGPYGKALAELAAAQHCAFLDMTTPWVEYLLSSKVHPHLFYRDPVHANEYGEQVLAKILLGFFTAPDHPGSASLPVPKYSAETGR